MTDEQHAQVMGEVDKVLRAVESEDLEAVELVILETLGWLRSLHPMPSRSHRIARLEQALTLVKKARGTE